jgi:hypothetical protein
MWGVDHGMEAVLAGSAVAVIGTCSALPPLPDKRRELPVHEACADPGGHLNAVDRKFFAVSASNP